LSPSLESDWHLVVVKLLFFSFFTTAKPEMERRVKTKKTNTNTKPTQPTHVESFEDALIQLCKKYQLITGDTDKRSTIQHSEKSTRTHSWEMRIQLPNCLLKLNLNHFMVFTSSFPPPLNEIIFLYLGKETSYMFLYTLHKNNRELWIGNAFWNGLKADANKWKTLFFKLAPQQDLVRFKDEFEDQSLYKEILAFRGERKELIHQLRMGKWGRSIYREFLLGYYNRLDLGGFEIFLRETKKTLNDPPPRRATFVNIIHKVIDECCSVKTSHTFDIFYPFLMCMLESIEPTSVVDRLDIEDMLLHKYPECANQIKLVMY
jgi:hypothetical protein